jgi:hypothetical protein
MIKFHADKLYVAFSYEEDGILIDFQKWESNEEACVYADLLQEFIDNGSAILNGKECLVSYDAIYQLSTYERHVLALPELYPYTIYVQPKGLLKDSSFRYLISYRQSKLGRRFKFKRTGGIITSDDSQYLLSMEQLNLVQSIYEFNQLPPESKTLNGNLIVFSQIKELSKKAKAILDNYLQKENVFVPSKLKIEIEKTGVDKFEIVPSIDSPLSDQFDRYLDSRVEAPENIALTDKKNNRVRVVLNEEKQKVINLLKRDYKRATSQSLTQLAAYVNVTS